VCLYIVANLRIDDLLLPPRSNPGARLSTFGNWLGADSKEHGVITLSVQRGDPGSFSSLNSILCQLNDFPADPRYRCDFTNVSASIQNLQAAERALAAEPTLDSAALASKGALAALRRVTRESADIAVTTDRAARLFAEVLVLPSVRRVVVPFADQIDRPSLKALARACLLAKRENAPIWEWHFSTEPSAPTDESDTADVAKLDSEVRADILRTIAKILRLTPTPRAEIASPVQGPNPNTFPQATVGIACNWLTTQNYDAAIRWAIAALATGPNIDALRVLAVAATNTGRHDVAIRAFSDAYLASGKPTLRAHLCSMRALIIAKRKLNLVESQRWYEQGLAELESHAPGDDGDRAIEEAWIYNGLALNALLARQSPDKDRQQPRRLGDE
jgi:tetratricopeptide (TPR) repeat protein